MVSLKRAAKLIQEGKIVAFPTETAYGLAVKAFDGEAAKKLYTLKGREPKKKVPILINSIEQLKGHAYLSNLGKYLSERLHPGPLNITLNSHHPWVGAFRISSSKTASKLVELSGPITATSANLAGKPTAFRSKDISLKVPVIESEKPLKKGLVSTVYDPIKLAVIRKGALPLNVIKRHVVAYHALQKVKPDKRHENRVVRIANKALAKIRKVHQDAVLGGSVAKKTFTNGYNDIDIFVLFDKGEDLEAKLPYLKKLASFGTKIRTDYAQHPYVKTDFLGFTVEIVPAYKTKPPEVLSAADRSRWHVKYVKDYTESEKDEVRIIKQFMKGIGVYGADSRVEGFSAYSMEVMAKKFGGFEKTLEWLIKQKHPLRLSDPVDKKRNILASLSRESFETTRAAAEAYLKEPSENFFFPPDISPLKHIPPRNMALIEFPRPDLVEDAVWGNLRSKMKKLVKNAKRHGFDIIRWSIMVEGGVYGAVKYAKGKELIMKGPPKSKKADVKKFKEKNNWFEEKGKLFSRKKVKYKCLKDYVNSFEEAQVFTGKAFENKYKKLLKGEKVWLRNFFENKQSWQY